MCGACGVISGGPDWIDRVNNPDGVGHKEDLTYGAERQRRIHLVNLLLLGNGSKVVDLGSITMLQGPTGRGEVVSTLTHVWSAVDRVGSHRIDPLDRSFLNLLAAH
jgi:hypothetical protein